MYTLTFWDYGLTPHAASWDTTRSGIGDPNFQPPKQGETVTFTVTPRHVSGAWQVKFERFESGPVQILDLCGSSS